MIITKALHPHIIMEVVNTNPLVLALEIITVCMIRSTLCKFPEFQCTLTSACRSMHKKFT